MQISFKGRTEKPIRAFRFWLGCIELAVFERSPDTLRASVHCGSQALRLEAFVRPWAPLCRLLSWRILVTCQLPDNLSWNWEQHSQPCPESVALGQIHHVRLTQNKSVTWTCPSFWQAKLSGFLFWKHSGWSVSDLPNLAGVNWLLWSSLPLIWQIVVKPEMRQTKHSGSVKCFLMKIFPWEICDHLYSS